MKRGDRVAVWLPNCPQWVALALAAKAVGEMVIAVNTRFRAHEVQDILGARRRRISPTGRVPRDRLRRDPGRGGGRGGADRRPRAEEIGPPATATPMRRGWCSRQRARPARRSSSCTPSAGSTRTPARSPTRRLPADDAVVLCVLPLCGVFGFCTLAGARAPGAGTGCSTCSTPARLGADRRTPVTNTTAPTRCSSGCSSTPRETLREGGFAAFNLEPRPLDGRRRHARDDALSVLRGVGDAGAGRSRAAGAGRGGAPARGRDVL